jgi:hypothetical protein
MSFSATLEIAAAIGAVAAYALSRLADPRRQARRAADRTATTPIADLEEDTWSRVSGIVEAAGATLTSPVEHHPCIGFRLLIRPVRRLSGLPLAAGRLALQRNLAQADRADRRRRSGRLTSAVGAQGMVSSAVAWWQVGPQDVPFGA